MKIVLNKQSKKYLASLNSSEQIRIMEAVAKLELEPPEGDIEKLKGAKLKEKKYRLRIGELRLLYKIKENANKEEYITIYKIAPRGQVYKD